MQKILNGLYMTKLDSNPFYIIPTVFIGISAHGRLNFKAQLLDEKRPLTLIWEGACRVFESQKKERLSAFFRLTKCILF